MLLLALAVQECAPHYPPPRGLDFSPCPSRPGADPETLMLFVEFMWSETQG